MLLIVTPPYSGSTAIAAMLETSPIAMLLQERGEGQWLVPGLCEPDRWDPDKKVDYASVRATWLRRFQDARRQRPELDLVIEKSPPNMVRLEAMIECFQRVSVFAYNREPLASCASLFHNHHAQRLLDGAERTAVVDALAHKWIQRSRTIRDLVERRNMPLLAYEQFCADPAGSIKRLGLPESIVNSIVPGANVSVKGGAPSPISNRNQTRTGVFTANDTDRLRDAFRTDPDLLAFFGYRDSIDS